MSKIILDTNFILSCLKFKIDFITDTLKLSPRSKLYILKGTLKELENKKFEKLAKEIIKKKKIGIIKSKDYVDDEILKLKGDFIIATNDKKLIKQLKLPIIRIKQKKYLILKL